MLLVNSNTAVAHLALFVRLTLVKDGHRLEVVPKAVQAFQNLFAVRYLLTSDYAVASVELFGEVTVALLYV